MARATEMISALKRRMRQTGLTYAMAAKHLDLSEASVKRLFSKGDFSLDRLELLCELVGLDLSELARLAEMESALIQHLTPEQETALVGDVKLLLVAIMVFNQWDFPRMLEYYQLTEPELIQALLYLERIGFLLLMPGNRIRLRVSRDFRWLPNGPIFHFFREKAVDDYLQSHFNGPGETFQLKIGMLTKPDLLRLQARLQKVAAEFEDLHQDSRDAPLDDRLACSMLLAIRPWVPQGFISLLRDPSVGAGKVKW